MTEVRLSSFNTGNFNKGAGFIKQTLWYFVNALFVRASWNPFMGIKVFFLKLFGAKIGKGLVIKNNVNIKFPWKLTLGNDVWLGENAWIDNLDEVIIGNNVCISQGALLLTGNHDYTLSTFDYRNASIIIEDGAWIGAKTVYAPSKSKITCYTNSWIHWVTRTMKHTEFHQGILHKSNKKYYKIKYRTL